MSSQDEDDDDDIVDIGEENLDRMAQHCAEKDLGRAEPGAKLANACKYII